MATLPQISLDFNRKIKLSNDGGALSSDTGSFLFREFDETIGFSKTINQHLHLKDDRLYHIHSNANLLRQKLYQIIAGYAEDDSADHLTTDPVFTQILGSDALASQPSLSRFWSRFDDTSIEQLDRANQTLLDKVHAHRQSEALIIDLDSTHADTYGAQEDAAYNTHYNTVGFHPIIAFDGMTGDFLKVKLRSAMCIPPMGSSILYSRSLLTTMKSFRQRHHSSAGIAVSPCRRCMSYVKRSRSLTSSA